MSQLGCRPLTNNEIDLIMSHLKTIRDKTLFSFLIYTGFRISEALSVKVQDIVDNRVKVQRENTKGKNSSGSSIIHPSLKLLLTLLIDESKLTGPDYLFSAKNVPNRPIGRVMSWKILNAARKNAGLIGKIGLHSTRKTFANRVYQRLDKDLLKTSKALRHKNLESTVKYLSFDTEEIDQVILEME